jgi:hypothetical protein
MDELKALGDLKVVRATWAMLTSADRFAKENKDEVERGQKRSRLLSELPQQGKTPHLSSEAGQRLLSDEAAGSKRTCWRMSARWRGWVSLRRDAREHDGAFSACQVDHTFETFTIGA